MGTTHHHLANERLVEVLGPGVDTLGNEIAAVDALVTHAAHSLLLSGDTVSLGSASVTFLACLAADFQAGGVRIGRSAEAKEG